jgi:hypothetical protein
MGQIKDTTKDRKGKHLIYEERIKIETLFNLGLTPKCIGGHLILQSLLSNYYCKWLAFAYEIVI